MPVVTVQLWPGKTKDQKKAMARSITDAIVEKGSVPAQSITVIFEEVPKESWASGGELAE